MFALSTRARYALRILVCLAAKPGETQTKQEIARQEEIPVDYVAQIVLRLRTAGLVSSQRGALGGFALAADAANITVFDVLTALEGPIQVASCQRDACSRHCACEEVWEAARLSLEATFKSYTVKSLMEREKALAASRAMTFDI